MNQRQKHLKGFTLIETVVSMVLLTVFSMGVFMFIQPITDLWQTKSFQQDSAFEARLALMRMAREIEEIRDRESITLASSNSFSFTDVDNQTIAYVLSSGTLSRNSVPLLKNVTSVQFQYIGQTSGGVDTTIVSPAVSPSSTDIRRIQLTLSVAANGNSATVQTQIHPRNLY